MALKMRKLKGIDIFPILGIVGNLGIKDDFVEIFKGEAGQPQDHKKKGEAAKETREEMIERRGIEIVANLIQKVLTNIESVGEDINRLLASLTETSVEEIEELDLAEYGELVVSFFKKPELQDFFKQLASFTK